MKLYYVSPNDGEDELYLFVLADTPLNAFAAWKTYYAGWELPKRVRVYDPCAAAVARGVLPWDVVPSTEFII